MWVSSENETIDRYGVSNSAVCKALLETERVGWAVRVNGKGILIQTHIGRPEMR